MNIIIKSIIKNIESKEANRQKLDKSKSCSNTDIADNSEGQIVLVKKQKNIYRRISHFLPNIESNGIYKLFGFVGINERAIEDQNYSESFFYAHLFGRVIQKVQIGKNAVIIDFQLPKPQQGQFPIQYILQRYKSKGNKNFYEVAELLDQLYQIFNELKPIDLTESQQNKSFNKTLESLGNDMFICTHGVAKIAISKSFLTYLEYDVQEFAVSAAKYRSIFTEFFSAKSYATGVKHIINMIKYIVEFSKGLITVEQLKELSTLSMTDFIYSKNGVKSYCSTTLFWVNIESLCHRVESIHYRSDQIPIKNCSQYHKAIQDQKSKIQQNEIQIIKQIKKIPRHLLNENTSKIASYKIIRSKTTEEKYEEGSDAKYIQ